MGTDVIISSGVNYTDGDGSSDCVTDVLVIVLDVLVIVL